MSAHLKYILPGLLLFAVLLQAFPQNYIGMQPAEIATALKSEYPQFKLDKSTVNPSYKYLKYVDKISEQTLLFFLTDNNVCTFVRWMSDYSNLNDMIGILNKKYRKSGQNTWSFSDRGENFTVKMEEEEWYFTVTFRKN